MDTAPIFHPYHLAVLPSSKDLWRALAEIQPTPLQPGYVAIGIKNESMRLPTNGAGNPAREI